MSLLHSEAVSRTLERAQQGARALNHDHLGTGHVLLGLAGEEASLAAAVLGRLRVSLPLLRLEASRGLSTVPPIPCPLVMTPALSRALVYADEEAHSFGQTVIDTEHLLLGLLREADGVAIGVLSCLGVTVEAVRQFVRELGGQQPSNSIQAGLPPALPASPPAAPAPVV